VTNASDQFWSPRSTRGVHGEFQELELQRAGETERHVLRISFPCKRRQLVARLRRLADEIEEGK
jgi:hypothetical protein